MLSQFLGLEQPLSCPLCDARGMLNNLFSFYTGVPSGGIEREEQSLHRGRVLLA